MTGRRLAVVPDGHRAVLYVRVSALMGRSGEEFHSPALQTKAMRDLIARGGLREVDVVEDIDVSGRTFARDGIQKIMDMARARQVDVVALYDLARLGRNTAESLRTIAELRELGVTVISTVEQIDDTPEGQFQLGVFLGMAQLYSDQVSRRWREVHAHRVEQGHAHGPAPLGYSRVDGRLQPNGDAPAVRAVFTGYAAGRLISHLTRDFNRATGRHSAIVAVKRMLRNPIYVGQVRFRGDTHPGLQEPLVSTVTWQRVQRRLGRDARTPSRLLAAGNPLAGLIRCQHCKRAMRMQAENRAAGIIRLRCPGKDEVGDCIGPGAPLLADVEAAVVAHIRDEYVDLEVDTAKQATRRAAITRATVDAQQLRRELAKLDRALQRAAADMYLGDVTEDEHRGATKLLREQADLLRDQLDNVERVSRAPDTRRLLRLSSSLLVRFDRLTVEERRRLFVSTLEVAWLRQASRWREPVADRLDVHLL